MPDIGIAILGATLAVSLGGCYLFVAWLVCRR